MRRKTRQNVGLIGLGIIGSRAAAGLRGAGYQVYVWNRTPRPAPNFLPTPGEVADVCQLIQLFVADSAAVMSVLEAIAPKLKPEHVIICSSTIGPEATLEAARYVEERGARFLDAPFTGSKLAAERSQLVYYVGGDDPTYLRVRPMLEATSKAIVRAGGIGDAALVKVVTNQIAAANIQVLAEALAIVRKAGLPPETLAAALEHHAVRSGVMDLKLPKMLSGDYEPHFSLKHMFKDVQLGIGLANALDLDTPATAVTAGVMFGAIKRGWADLDFCSIYKLYETEEKKIGSLTNGGESPRRVQAEHEIPPPNAEPAPTPEADAAESPLTPDGSRSHTHDPSAPRPPAATPDGARPSASNPEAPGHRITPAEPPSPPLGQTN
jgi:3-hydroxyisobutyrate dehydrogenase-like beta-hydroxyacid dehydrogenase